MILAGNIDTFIIGTVVAFMLATGVLSYFSNTKNATNRTFLLFSLASILWSVLNYFSYKFTGETALLIIRGVMAAGIWFVFTLFLFLITFPKDKIPISKNWLKLLATYATILTFLSFSHFLFEGIATTTEDGFANTLTTSWGMLFYAPFVLGLVVAGLLIFTRNALESRFDKARLLVLSGIIITFILVLTFNFILPAFLDNSEFIEYGEIFILPFIFTSTLALLKFGFLGAKSRTTGVVVSTLSLVTFVEIFFASTYWHTLIRVGEFLLVLLFGLILLRSVVKEVKQREEIEILARDLEKSNKKLEELNALKTRFMSMASHDLRSPLGAVKGYASMLLEGTYGKLGKGSEEAVKNIYDVSEHMRALVEDFLNLSRIQAGRMKYSFETKNLVELVKSTVNEQIPASKEKGLELKFATTSETYNVKLDEVKIRQILTNLIDNAIKYTPSGSVSISITELAQEQVRVTIKDSGIGMTQEAMKGLFKEFSRLKGGEDTNKHGTGLGLYISKVMIEEHKGKIWAESEGEGKGSSFIIELPLV